MKSIVKWGSLTLVILAVLTGCGIKDSVISTQPQSTISETSSTKPEPEPVTDDIVAPTDKNSDTVILGKKSENASTYTGLMPLDEISYNIPDPENSKGLSTEKVCHSHGPASGGKAHHTVLEFQKTFEKYGGFTVDTKTEEKVLYLTFDCGYEYNNLTNRILDVLKEKEVPAAFFCTLHHIKEQPELISRMINEGHIVGNHSTTHPSFAEISREEMGEEIQECENYLRQNFGYAAKYFRFPAGEYTESALDAVNSMGYASVFWSVAYADWDVNNSKGKDYAVSTVMDRLHPGAVILLHAVSQDNADALGEIIDKARAEGYEFRGLDEYPA